MLLGSTWESVTSLRIDYNKVQVMTTFVIMLSNIVLGSCVTDYYIYLTYHIQVEYF